MEDKKDKIVKRIEELGKLDDDLKNRILDASTLVELEDLYRPLKAKANTRNKGTWKRSWTSSGYNFKAGSKAKRWKNSWKVCYRWSENTARCNSGAQDIIAEIISDNSTFRKKFVKIHSLPARLKQRQKTRTFQQSMMFTITIQKALKGYLPTGF